VDRTPKAAAKKVTSDRGLGGDALESRIGGEKKVQETKTELAKKDRHRRENKTGGGKERKKRRDDGIAQAERGLTGYKGREKEKEKNQRGTKTVRKRVQAKALGGGGLESPRQLCFVPRIENGVRNT